MHLLLSDVHFGKGSRSEESAKEDDLLHLLEHLSDSLEGVYLLGDVFDQFIEYRHLVPKGHVRFLAALSRLASGNVEVTYLVGNHDPWHLDYFEDELGVTVHANAHRISVDGVGLLLSHGDGIGRGLIARAIRQFTRHPISMALYRTLLPADLGYRFARFTKKRLESDESPDPVVIERLRSAARDLLGQDHRVVVLGHSHQAEVIEWPEGIYVNTGSWHHDRSVTLLEQLQSRSEPFSPNSVGDVKSANGCRIRQGKWNGTEVLWYSDVEIAARDASPSTPHHNTDLRRSFGVT